jgi:hypothetical protein
MSKPTHYYLDAGNSNQPKNKLEKEFVYALQCLSGSIILANEIDQLIENIKEHQAELNKKYSRCKPLVISFFSFIKEDSIAIHGVCLRFKIKAATLYKVTKL